MTEPGFVPLIRSQGARRCRARFLFAGHSAIEPAVDQAVENSEIYPNPKRERGIWETPPKEKKIQYPDMMMEVGGLLLSITARSLPSLCGVLVRI
jgi:hypothetical protein